MQEACANDGGRAAHSKWRNYDDFNEYFWFVLQPDINLPIGKFVVWISLFFNFSHLDLLQVTYLFWVEFAFQRGFIFFPEA